jgi:GNAT superfamily N-acetyltransferase
MAHVMYQPSWLDTKITINHQSSTATNASAMNRPATNIPAIKQWSAVKLFYRQHMPYARLAQKESVAVIHNINSSTTDDTQLSQHKIIAAIRVRPIGQYQLISGLLVHPHYRGQQVSTQLLRFIAPQLTVRQCFLFANPRLVGLYQRHHFVLIDPSEFARLPADIMQLYRRYHSEQRPLVVMQLNDAEVKTP